MSRIIDVTMISDDKKALDFIISVLQASTEYALIGADLTGKIVLWNEGARRLYGYEPVEAIGKLTLSALHTQDNRVANLDLGMIKVTLKKFKWQGKIKQARKNGDHFTAQVELTPRLDLTGNPIGFLFISRDITKKIDLKNKFRSNMNHAMRTPLNGIIGFTGLLLMEHAGPLNDAQKKQINIVNESAQHLLSLINTGSELENIKSKRTPLKIEPISWQSVISEITPILSPLADAKKLQLIIDSHNEDTTINTDRQTLTQIILNIARNAIQFTGQGEVKIQLEKKKENTIITITDTGVGVKPEDQVQLFAAFPQMSTKGKQKQGPGLGLFISKKLAALINSKIKFVSEPGKGSKFSIVLPKD
jgi:PAS domain S-box-containing protein